MNVHHLDSIRWTWTLFIVHWRSQLGLCSENLSAVSMHSNPKSDFFFLLGFFFFWSFSRPYRAAKRFCLLVESSWRCASTNPKCWWHTIVELYGMTLFPLRRTHAFVSLNCVPRSEMSRFLYIAVHSFTAVLFNNNEDWCSPRHSAHSAAQRYRMFPHDFFFFLISNFSTL